MFHAKSTSSSAPFCMFKQNVCISALKALLVTMSGEAVNSNRKLLPAVDVEGYAVEKKKNIM